MICHKHVLQYTTYNIHSSLKFMHTLIALKFIDKQTNLFIESKEIFLSCLYSSFCELRALVYNVVEINIIVTE